MWLAQANAFEARNLSRSGVSGVTGVTIGSYLSNSPYQIQGVRPKFEISTLVNRIISGGSSLSFARIFERGQCSFRELFNGDIPTFESNIAYTLRFMIDTKVS